MHALLLLTSNATPLQIRTLTLAALVLVLIFSAAEPLDKSTLDRLRKTLESSKTVKEYKTLKIHNRVQADLLGGLVVDFGDEKSVDLSVKSRVQKLEQLITRESGLSSEVLSRMADCWLVLATNRIRLSKSRRMDRRINGYARAGDGG